MTRIAVDAMGGDQAPDEIVRGARAAAGAGVEVLLVGNRQVIEPLLDDDEPLELVHASQVIGMGDDPARAIRDKKDASITVCARLVSEGRAAGLVSAGSTGAAMAAAAFVIGRLPGVSRPAIASIFPTGKIVLDSGANLECRAEHLVQFAIMGDALARTYFGIAQPRIGLVNIGEEPGKGRELEKAAYDLLAAAGGFDFVGNVEGRDLGRDHADVFVTDGFTGNVLLKTAEGTARLTLDIVGNSLSAPEFSDAVATLGPAFRKLEAELDAEAIGGAHLLGVDGVVVIAHGSSSHVAVSNAITMAAEGAAHGLVEAITAGLALAPR